MVVSLQVKAVYVLDPRCFQHDEFAWTVGKNRMGIYQTRFLLESLANLK